VFWCLGESQRAETISDSAARCSLLASSMASANVFRHSQAVMVLGRRIALKVQQRSGLEALAVRAEGGFQLGSLFDEELASFL
jgi:hypothetical protein